MTRIICIANHKGGVGKTTSVAFIGEALARKGQRVLLVDLDAQANLTGFFLKEDEVEARVYDALVRGVRLPVVKVLSDSLYLSPSSLELARAETELAARIARERILANLLEPVAADFDFILLDCPPSLGIITMNAIVAATEIYVPLTAEALPFKGLSMLEEVVEQIRETLSKGAGISGVIITRYNNRKLNKAVIEAIRTKYGARVFSTIIRENIALAETPICGGDLFSYAPTSNGAQDYSLLADEILNR